MKILSAADGWTVVPSVCELELPLADPLETNVALCYQYQVAVHEFWLPHFRVQVAVLSAANADPEKTVGTDVKASARTVTWPTTALFIPLFSFLGLVVVELAAFRGGMSQKASDHR